MHPLSKRPPSRRHARGEPGSLTSSARYYGWRVALYIAGIMYVSIMATALILNGAFALLGLIPEGKSDVAQLTQFKLDYTFFLNMVAALIAAAQGVLSWQQKKHADSGSNHDHDDGEGLSVKRLATYVFLVLLAGGLVAYVVTGGTG